ncbi:hypothetical protein PAXINDRAFT_173802 [Paxillus involutus ATCC 200175]|nr:hypothetical protein PAXINDRAFT_173802 [Paxillus involutus ATCC 200175]
MSSSNFASSFSPYTLPPDDPSRNSMSPSATGNSQSRIWPSPYIPPRPYETSYQSGGTSLFNTFTSAVNNSVDEEQQSQWETKSCLRVDVLAASAYLLGPISALILLITETHNDYVRFHAYQSALLMTPLLVVRILVSLLRFPSWFCTFFTLLLSVSALSMAAQAFSSASGGRLSRYHLPKLGTLADRWVSEE